MNHGRILNNRTNTLHERALKLVYNDFKSDNASLELTDSSIKMFKDKNNSAPEIMELWRVFFL